MPDGILRIRTEADLGAAQQAKGALKDIGDYVKRLELDFRQGKITQDQFNVSIADAAAKVKAFGLNSLDTVAIEKQMFMATERVKNDFVSLSGSLKGISTDMKSSNEDFKGFSTSMREEFRAQRLEHRAMRESLASLSMFGVTGLQPIVDSFMGMQFAVKGSSIALQGAGGRLAALGSIVSSVAMPTIALGAGVFALSSYMNDLSDRTDKAIEKLRALNDELGLTTDVEKRAAIQKEKTKAVSDVKSSASQLSLGLAFQTADLLGGATGGGVIGGTLRAFAATSTIEGIVKVQESNKKTLAQLEQETAQVEQEYKLGLASELTYRMKLNDLFAETQERTKLLGIIGKVQEIDKKNEEDKKKDAAEKKKAQDEADKKATEERKRVSEFIASMKTEPLEMKFIDEEQKKRIDNAIKLTEWLKQPPETRRTLVTESQNAFLNKQVSGEGMKPVKVEHQDANDPWGTKRALEKSQHDLNTFEVSVSDASQNMGGTIGRTIGDGLTSAFGIGHTLLGQFVNDVVSQFMSLEASGLIKGLLGVVSGGGTTLLGSIFGFADGGWIPEPVMGVGMQSKSLYTFGEKGPEYVTPNHQLDRMSHSGIGRNDNDVSALTMRVDSLTSALVNGVWRFRGDDLAFVVAKGNIANKARTF